VAADDETATEESEVQVKAVVAGETAAAEDEVPVQVWVAADDETATEEGEVQVKAVVAGETAAAEDEVPVQVQVAADDETATEEGEDEQPALISQPTVTDVILESVKTPLKAKRGIPSFYSGKVSPSCICQPHILAESTHEK